MSVILQAAHIAEEWHRGQTRKFSGLPYITHPARVAGRVALYTSSEEVVAAAYLHDVLEDTPMKAEGLEKLVGSMTTRLVVELTNPSKGMTVNRAARKEIDRAYLKKVSAQARLIKMLDRIDNMADMVDADDGFRKLYADESLRLLAVINQDMPYELFSEFVQKAERLARES